MLSGAQFTYKLCYLFLKRSLREERPYGELLKVFAKHITVTEKKDTKGVQRTEKITSNYENTMTKGERRGYRRSKTKKTRQEREGSEGRGLKGKTREELARHRGERRRERRGRKKGRRRRKRRRKRKISTRRRSTEVGKGWRRKKKTNLYMQLGM